jgi:hypothetical protein
VDDANDGENVNVDCRGVGGGKLSRTCRAHCCCRGLVSTVADAFLTCRVG